jgi:hypothetical protein
MEVKKKEGRMEYWSIGVMEYWKDQKTGDRIERNGRMEYWSIGVMEYWKEGKTPAFPPSVPPLAGLRRTGAKASGFATATPRQDGVARETRIKRNGRMEGWGKEIPPDLPLEKGGDQWERWKNGKGEPLGPELTAEGRRTSRFRKDGRVGKAGGK